MTTYRQCINAIRTTDTVRRVYKYSKRDLKRLGQRVKNVKSKAIPVTCCGGLIWL
jgi:hypothetical protein